MNVFERAEHVARRLPALRAGILEAVSDGEMRDRVKAHFRDVTYLTEALGAMPRTDGVRIDHAAGDDVVEAVCPDCEKEFEEVIDLDRVVRETWPVERITDAIVAGDAATALDELARGCAAFRPAAVAHACAPKEVAS